MGPSPRRRRKSSTLEMTHEPSPSETLPTALETTEPASTPETSTTALTAATTPNSAPATTTTTLPPPPMPLPTTVPLLTKPAETRTRRDTSDKQLSLSPPLLSLAHRAPPTLL